jgi:hypothetical protein
MSISSSVVIMTQDELLAYRNEWFQKGVERGRFEERSDQSRAKEPEAGGGLCRAATHAVQVGEADAALPATSEHMDVTAGETAPPSQPADRREIVARECADELVQIVEAAERVAKRTGNTFVIDRAKVAAMIRGHLATLNGGK